MTVRSSEGRAVAYKREQRGREQGAKLAGWACVLLTSRPITRELELARAGLAVAAAAQVQLVLLWPISWQPSLGSMVTVASAASEFRA